MSWFPERMAEAGPTEVEEGVLLERRSLLKASVGALAREPSTDDDAELAWDALAKAALPLAE